MVPIKSLILRLDVKIPGHPKFRKKCRGKPKNCVNIPHIMSKNTSKKNSERLIIANKKARHDYQLEQFFEAGLVLEGWEVKSIRANKVQIRDGYVILKNGEAWLIGSHITPLNTVSTHFQPDSQRSRKLLLNENELAKLFGAVNRQGYTIVPVDLHWHKNRIKIEIALAKGKQTHDKRHALKEQEWNRQKQRILLKSTK